MTESETPPDPWAGAKIAAVALVAWAVIGLGLRATSTFDLADSVFAGALLLAALVGVGISARGMLDGPSKLQSTVGLILNVMLAVGAILLGLSAEGGP